MVSGFHLCLHLLLPWPLMIQLSLSFQSTRTQHEMAQASMNAKGFASNRFVKESVDPGKDKILFGGAKHKDGGRKSGDWKFRPETIKTFSCEGEECTECTDPSSCWHGRGAGTLELKVPPTNPNSRFVFEAWASCGKGGGKWDLTVRNFANGHYSVYINGVLDWKITEAQFKRRKKNGFLRKTIRFTKDAHVRVEFFRTDSTLDAFARVALRAKRVDPHVDRCMGVKDCLSKLGDGNTQQQRDDGFKLRSSNKLQLQCVEASDPVTISSTCAKWTGCLSEKNELINMTSILRAAVGTDVPSVIPASLSDMTARAKPEDEVCVDPSIADPESWECECSEEMFAKCSSGNIETCLQNLMCENPGICHSWKQNNCETSLSSSANVLDDSLRGKCSV